MPKLNAIGNDGAAMSVVMPMVHTILVVEDDPVMCRVLEAIITRHGLKVITAPGGGPALDILLSRRGKEISLVLLDLIMPDVNGIEVLTKLRAANKELPVIVLTARGGTASEVEAMRAGANDFLVKPASPERIMGSIKCALGPEVRSIKNLVPPPHHSVPP